MGRNEQFVWCSEGADFKIHTTRAYRTARFTYDKHWISLKLPKLRTLQHTLHIMAKQLTMFTEAMRDVHAYVNAQMTSCDCVETHITLFK